ncbi:hypothetical protein PPL_00999 [Heterostelium album PN500]|uniref:Uncharacterized protein n=1 Tax=Heterostelium pallidum (strain ATCC 26659 / Pp 5 / PN500) TaxID=670386 RepID=D3AXU2_HETP5|nr:hypothetical protein PPL_00999 [Heterostelium album PN500]EFA85769.1 hypothetical protein PPL_00999 [Heterostelium album PN500]|eukprot:XP_020437875.1 hypothetical protein PPL_00999 [Heterostelium album PN500]
MGVLCQYNTSLSIILDAGLDQSDQGAIPIAEQHPAMALNAPQPPPPPPGNYNNNHHTHNNRGSHQQQQTNQNNRNNRTFNQNEYHLNQSYDTELQMAIALSMADAEGGNIATNNHPIPPPPPPPSSKFNRLRSSIEGEEIEKIENTFFEDNDNEFDTPNFGNGPEQEEEEEIKENTTEEFQTAFNDKQFESGSNVQPNMDNNNLKEQEEETNINNNTVININEPNNTNKNNDNNSSDNSDSSSSSVSIDINEQ